MSQEPLEWADQRRQLQMPMLPIALKTAVFPRRGLSFSKISHLPGGSSSLEETRDAPPVLRALPKPQLFVSTAAISLIASPLSNV